MTSGGQKDGVGHLPQNGQLCIVGTFTFAWHRDSCPEDVTILDIYRLITQTLHCDGWISPAQSGCDE